MGASFFTSSGSWYEPTDECRGPWDPAACHAGPPTGLLARTSERLVPDQQLVRLTVELTRPIPHSGFSVDGEVLRSGRTVTTTSLTITDGDGRQVAAAHGMHLSTTSGPVPPTPRWDGPRLDSARPGAFPIRRIGHDLPMFSSGVEMMYPPGHGPSPGPTVAWMRTLPLLPDEEPSPFQRICPLADCGNAISRNTEATEFGFLNTDLTLALHRAPEGDWLGTESVSRWEPNGIGMSDSLLFDHRGPVGRALQSLVVRVAS